MNKLYCLSLIVATFLLSCKTKGEHQSDWLFEKTDSSKLVFKGGKSFDTKLFNLKYIGQIPIENKPPFLIFSGVDCNECDANACIYIHSPSDKVFSVGQGQNCYLYPGKQNDYETNALIYDARTFYGQVLNGIKGVIWYQKELSVDGKWKSSIFLAKIIGETKIDTVLNENGQLKETISLMNKGLCKEIPGITTTSEP